MPDPRMSYPDRRTTYGAVDTHSIPTDPHRERMTYARRLAFLQMLGRPETGAPGRPTRRRSGRGSAT